MFDVRQAARGAFAPSRPRVCPSAEFAADQLGTPASHPHDGGPFGRPFANADIIHGYLNGTYYLVTYNGFRRRKRAPRVPPSHGPRRAAGCFRMSMGSGARAPLSERDAVEYNVGRSFGGTPESKLRRGGGS
jgi:hypothetical protein